MGDLTKNLSRSELACSCGCGADSMDYETVMVFQESCDHFAGVLGVAKVVATISSAHRCFEYNRLPVADGGPGSNDNSQHPQARALDYTIKDVTPAALYAHLDAKYPDKYGMGAYSTFIHLDTAFSFARRW